MELTKLSPNESNGETPATHRCGVCGTPRAAGVVGGQCPRCLLSLGSSFGLPGDDEAADDLLDPMQVRRFGDYELLGEIARGGMGVVYRARQISLDREVAVKMILAGELAGKAALRLFQNEAHAAATLHHPNIVPVYEIGERETQHYFTMRFVPGGQTIADWARAEGDDYRAIAGAVARVARAVAYAHERGVLHRDLKPSNILWDPAGEPQVTDFGLAKVLASADGMATFSAQALGSPSYMAPEQMNGRTAEITTATDVYGLGAVLYELLSGKPPFAGDSALETMRRAAEEAPRPLPKGPKDLRTICLKCLEKKQPDRYRSAAALADDLERFTRGEPVSAVPLTPPQILLRWAARKPRVAALLGLFIASLLVAIIGISWQWRRTESARAGQAKTLAHLGWQQMTAWAHSGEEPRALAFLASLIRERPGNWQAVMYAMSIVDRRSLPVLAGPVINPPAPLLPLTSCLAPDGSWLAAAGEDRTVRIWETASGKETAQFSCASPITALAIADGLVKLAVATEDGGLAVAINLNAAPTLLSRGEKAPINALSFSDDGTRLLARSAFTAEVRLTSAISQPPRAFTLSEKIEGADISDDGARVLAWSAREAVVWEANSGAELLRVPAEQSIERATLSANGQRIAMIDGQYFARAWDVDARQQLSRFESPLSLMSWLALDRAGERLTTTANADLIIHDVVSGLAISPPMQHHYDVVDFRATPDGARTVSVGWDGAIKLWDARSGRPLVSPIQLGGSIRDADTFPSRDGGKILVHLPPRTGRAESITVWRGTRTCEPERRVVEGERDFDAGRMSPDERLGALGMIPGNRSYVYDLRSGKVLLDHSLGGRVYVHLFSPDMRKCYALTANGWLYGWSLGTGAPLWPPNQQPGLIRPADISSDGSRIIAGHDDGHIRIYDTATGMLVQTLDHPGEIKVLRFAPDGSGRFVSASTDGLAHVWNLASGEKLQTFSGHSNAIIAAAWSPDSRYVATASYDSTARVWDAASGRPVGQPLQHQSWLAHLEWSPDGQLLATASRDGTARFWHPLTGEPASAPLPQDATCETVRFTADGKALLVRDQTGFSFWDVQNPEPITVHYVEPDTSGLGMDAVNYRSIMSANGERVFLGCSMNYGALWSVPQPRGTAPAWFPDFLETLAGLRLDRAGEARSLPATEIGKFLPMIRAAAADDEYARWAERVIGSDGR